MLNLLFGPLLACFVGYMLNHYIFKRVDVMPLMYVMAEVVYLMIVKRKILYELSDTVIETMVQSGNRGFINNFYVCAERRNSGVGSEAYRMVENHLRSLGAKYIELVPAKMAESFYIRNGFEFSRTSSDGETVFGKVI